MIRGNRREWARATAVTLTVITGAVTGCSPSTLYFLFRGENKQKAEYPLEPAEGKKGVTVAVLVSTPDVGRMDTAGADRDLAAALARRLAAESKDDKHPVSVVEQAKVDKAKANHPTWQVSPWVIGQKLDADYVMDVSVNSLSLYDPTYGKEAYKGQADVRVVVYKVADAGAGPQEYFLQPRAELTSNGSMPAAAYRQKLLDRVAAEITWKHVAHVADRDSARR